MKIRRILLTVAVVLSVHLLPAQIAPFGIRNNDLGPVQSGASDSDSIIQLIADIYNLPAVDQPPFSGTFWTIMPGFGSPLPFPCPPLGINLPTYALPNGAFLVDDTATTNTTSEADLLLQAAEVTNLIAQAQTVTTLEQNHPMARAMGDGLPVPGDGGEGGEVITNAPYALPDYGTNLWIASPNIALNEFGAFASNTIADVEYEIQSVTNLVPTTNWVSQGFFLGSETTNYTPLNSLAVSLTNNCFIRLRSWIDTDGIGIPDWWQIAFFGYVGIDPYGDPTGDGYSNVYKFLHGMSPNIFYPPTAPQSLSASYNLTTGTETLTWSPSPGGVTSYTLTVNNEQTGQTTNITLSVTNTSFTMYLAPQSPDLGFAPNGPQINVIYGLQANYGTHGSSPLASQLAEGDAAPSAQLVNGADGRLCYLFQGLPEDLSAVRIYRSNQAVPSYYIDIYNVDTPFFLDDQLQTIDYTPLADGFFEMPTTTITNGICELPDSQVPPYVACDFWVQTVRSNGVDSAWTASNPTLNDTYSASKPYLDVRRQLKDNLIFLLRAATPSSPFTFNVNPDGYPTLFTWPNSYVYADFYNNYNNYYSTFRVDELLPLHENYLFRNFAFNPDLLAPDGFLNTGCYEEFPTLITNYPAFYFDAAAFITATNPAVPSSQLSPALSQWLMQSGSVPGPFDGGPVTGQTNCYGLPEVSEKDDWVSSNQVNAETFYPGDTGLNGVSGVSYIDTAQPGFQSAGYYFARLNLDPLPETSGFSPAGTPPTLFAGVGNTLTVAGYNELAVTNGYPGVYGYLGQYFDQAYQINTNGVTTDNSAGVLSPYGVFSPTIPGPVALVTMPDIDPPYERGTCTVDAVSLVLDKNHDLVMDKTFNGPDATSQSSPFVFWINDDYDYSGASWDLGHDVEATPYYNDGAMGLIDSQRDLEDYARLWICGMPALTNGGYQVTLSWANVSRGVPTVNLFNSVETNGGVGYLTNSAIAAAQYGGLDNNYPGSPGKAIATISPSQPFTFPASYFTNAGDKYFLFDGAITNGTGELMLTIADGSGNTIAQTGTWLDMHDVKEFYERAVITNNISSIAISNWTSGIEAVQQATASALGDDTNLIVLVHGFNVASEAWLIQSDTVFKRLYWAGYRGKFMTVKWPAEPITAWNVISENTSIFNNSEIKSYKAGTALKNYLSQLRGRFPNYQLNVLAHSQGNAIMGEAIEQGAPFDNYILTQAAMPASCYDVNAPTVSTLLTAEFVYGTPELQPMGYQGVYTNFTGRILNLYNPYDPVLALWIADQAAGKPNGYANHLLSPLASYYSYDGVNGWNNGTFFGVFSSSLVTDPQESRAMISRSLTESIGRSGPASAHGVIQSALDLNAQYGFFNSFPGDHSAQWVWPI